MSNLAEYSTVAESDNFAVLLNPAYDPLNKDSNAYYLVFKKYNTVEIAVNSYPAVMYYFKQAEDSLANVLNGDKDSLPSVEKLQH